MKMMRSFLLFQFNGAPVEWNWHRKTEVLGGKPVPVPLCPPQIPHGLTRDRTLASAVRGRRLTAWAMARPFGLRVKSQRGTKRKLIATNSPIVINQERPGERQPSLERQCYVTPSYDGTMLRCVRKIAKSDYQFRHVCLSVCPPAWNNSVPTGRIFTKSDIWVFFQNSVEKIQFSFKSDNNNGYFTRRLCTFMIVSRWILLRMWNFSDKSCRENQNTNFVFNNVCSENRAVYEIMWKNMV
jgi:hypothetical protein